MYSRFLYQGACYSCGRVLDAVIGDSRPKEGDLSICAHCAAIGIFTEAENKLHLRQMSGEEWEGLPTEVTGKLLQVQSYLKERISKKEESA